MSTAIIAELYGFTYMKKGRKIGESVREKRKPNEYAKLCNF
jgi:hypothetical protein